MILSVATVTTGLLTVAAMASRPVVPAEATVPVLAVGLSFAAIGLICRIQLGVGGASLLIGVLGVGWLVLLASASAAGSPAFGGAVVTNVVVAALGHLLLGQVPSRLSGAAGRKVATAGYATAVAAGLLTGPPAARPVGAALVALAVAGVFAVVVLRIRESERATARTALPVLLPAGVALVACLSATLAGLDGDPPTWLMHSLFWFLAVTPVGFLIVVARRALAQTRASRARVLHAADAERRRIERDLHDGVQQHLVSAAVLLDLLARRLDGTEASGTLQKVAATLTGARDELRHICRRINPNALADDGLDAALAELVWHIPLRVTVSGRAGPLPSEAASAAYYVTAEALTNTVKHAGATAAHVELARDATGLRIVITDDGRGGADPARGTGLRGLTDRVEAAGGRLDVRDRRPGGTVVAARIPCTS